MLFVCNLERVDGHRLKTCPDRRIKLFGNVVKSLGSRKVILSGESILDRNLVPAQHSDLSMKLAHGPAQSATAKIPSPATPHQFILKSSAFRIATLETVVAAFNLHEGRDAALRTLGHGLGRGRRRESPGWNGLRQSAEVQLDDVADRREE